MNKTLIKILIFFHYAKTYTIHSIEPTDKPDRPPQFFGPPLSHPSGHAHTVVTVIF